MCEIRLEPQTTRTSMGRLHFYAFHFQEILMLVQSLQNLRLSGKRDDQSVATAELRDVRLETEHKRKPPLQRSRSLLPSCVLFRKPIEKMCITYVLLQCVLFITLF